MHVVTITEPTTLLRDFLRVQFAAAVAIDGSGRAAVYAGGLPAAASYPALVLSRVGGTLDGPLDLAAFRFDCWAETASVAAALSGIVCSYFATAPPTEISTSPRVEISGWQLSGGPTYFPDPDQPKLQRMTFVAQATCKTLP